MPPAKNLTSVRMMLSGFIGLAVVYAGTAVYTFQLRAVDEHDCLSARGVRLHVPVRGAVSGAATAATTTARSDAVLPHVQLQPLL